MVKLDAEFTHWKQMVIVNGVHSKSVPVILKECISSLTGTNLECLVYIL